MITILINAKVKHDYLEEYKALATLLTQESRTRAGCISYTFHQRIDKPTEFVLYEQWENQSYLDSHIQALVTLLGSPQDGKILPEKLLHMYEYAEPIFYNTIE